MSKVRSARTAERGDAVESLDLRFDDLDALLGYRVRRAQGAIHRDYMAAIAGLDVTQKQTATLWLIHANPGVSQASLASSLGMDRATMMAVVDRLEDRGFVIRQRSVADRRRQELYLTPAGQGFLRKVKTRIVAHERRFTACFKPAELAALMSALTKIARA
ncbi:MAG: MarR family transcriptional regulator [Hyphomonadaceae bacterium]|nr:MarR family transcriptional regulator [Hyphomonadaceae bacterium]